MTRPGSSLVSIIICTHNRAEHLRRTLAALAGVSVPDGMSAELVIVDNNSTDATATVIGAVIQQNRLPNMENVRSVLELRQGLSSARNRGMAEARGDIFLFTDDDVRPPDNWLQGMCGPIVLGEADAVAGGMKLAAHLLRPWMTATHISWLASTECVPAGTVIPLLGGNMAFSRRVLARVPQFDVEVGPGAKGHADDSLFSYQLEKAGCRIVMALETAAEHHLQEERLTRKSYEAQARKRGEFNAYLARHWAHSDPRYPLLRLVRSAAALWGLRLWHFPEWVTSPTVPAWELSRLEWLHMFRFSHRYRNEPRKYEKFGLVKLEQS